MATPRPRIRVPREGNDAKGPPPAGAFSRPGGVDGGGLRCALSAFTDYLDLSLLPLSCVPGRNLHVPSATHRAPILGARVRFGRPGTAMERSGGGADRPAGTERPSGKAGGLPRILHGGSRDEWSGVDRMASKTT